MARGGSPATRYNGLDFADNNTGFAVSEQGEVAVKMMGDSLGVNTRQRTTLRRIRSEEQPEMQTTSSSPSEVASMVPLGLRETVGKVGRMSTSHDANCAT